MTANQKGILPKFSIDRPKIGSFLEDKKCISYPPKQTKKHTFLYFYSFTFHYFKYRGN